jgi:hypothetical protein
MLFRLYRAYDEPSSSLRLAEHAHEETDQTYEKLQDMRK